jgi:hypothetical protein
VTTGTAFSPAAASGFVYDDHGFYSGNSALVRPSIVWRAFVDPSCQRDNDVDAGLWRPLRTLSYALDRAVFGGGAVGPHAVNVGLHAASTGLLFLLLRRFGIGTIAALAGALLFGLHPAQTECVAWLSSRGDVLAMALVFAAILLDLSGRAGLALAAGAAALLSKEQAVVWPALAFVAFLLAGSAPRDAARRLIGPAVLVAAFLVARRFVGIENAQDGGLGLGRAGLPQIASMLGHQVWYSLLPVGSLFDWQMPWDVHPFPVVLAGLGAVAALAWRPTHLAALWFLAALVPTLFVQAVLPLNIAVCDRWLLFALPALAIVAAKTVDRVGPAPAFVGALAFVALTETQIPVWRSDATLWTRTAERIPGHPRANHWLGMDAIERRDFAEAVARLRLSESTKGKFHLACALDALGRTTRNATTMMEAHKTYREADRLYDVDARAEGRAGLEPLARIGSVDAALLYSAFSQDDEFGAERLKELLAKPRPTVIGDAAQGWNLRIESISASAAANPSLGPAWAERVRQWGRLP